ncbi:MAG: DNA-binding response regulator [Chloroflexi bacterium RIFOXYD12_FULL_57_15]|nr:MAG: DNA-binding response regulator [Chloroflexi bacterium RIFOXYD12_FULL_57_15]
MITVYLVDDQRILREGLRALLELDGSIQVVGEAADGRAALDGILAVQPEVVLMDVTMPDLNGIDAAQILTQKAPQIKVIILSVHSDSEHVYRAFQAGATGYLLKESAGAEVLAAVRAAKQNRRYVSPKIADALALRRDKRSPFESLSAREREVLQLTVAGSTSAAIAGKLNLSPKTVDTYRSRVMGKLGVQNLPELVRLAIKHGLTPAE